METNSPATRSSSDHKSANTVKMETESSFEETTDECATGLSEEEYSSEWEENRSGDLKTDSSAKPSTQVPTLDELIKNYVRTMHIPPVTDWHDLSDSEEEKDKEHQEEEVLEFNAPIDLLNQENGVPPREEDSVDDWQTLFKDKAITTSKLADEKYRACLLDVHSYGTLYHMPYEEMAMRDTDQCSGCNPLGELGRCVCCGGSAFSSPSCKLDKTHVRQRLVKEARVYHLMEAGRDFSETELLEWNSKEWNVTCICRPGSEE